MKRTPIRHDSEIRDLLQRQREAMLANNSTGKPSEVRNQMNNGVLELFIYDVIGEDFWGFGVSALEVAQILAEHPEAKTIRVRINSPGGSVFDGVAIYNSLLAHGAQIEVQVDGQAASVAALIAMAGDPIRMGTSTRLMIHRASSYAWGNEEDFDRVAEILRQVDGEIAGVFAARTGKTLDEIQQLLKAETFMTADEAVAEGFADEVVSAVSRSGPDNVFNFQALRIAALCPNFYEATNMPKNKNQPKAGQATGSLLTRSIDQEVTNRRKEGADADRTESDVRSDVISACAEALGVGPEIFNKIAEGEIQGALEHLSDGRERADRVADALNTNPDELWSAESTDGSVQIFLFDTPAEQLEGDAVPATFDQLQKICDSKDNDWVVAQLDAGATEPAARGAWVTRMGETNAELQNKLDQANQKIGLLQEGESSAASSGEGESDAPPSKLQAALGDGLAAYAAGLRVATTPSSN